MNADLKICIVVTKQKRNEVKVALVIVLHFFQYILIKFTLCRENADISKMSFVSSKMSIGPQVHMLHAVFKIHYSMMAV